MNTHTQAIVKRCGGPIAVGRICGISRAAVYLWDKVPAKYVLRLARKSPAKITPHEIRRDLYPHPLDGMRGAVPPVKRGNGKAR